MDVILHRIFLEKQVLFEQNIELKPFIHFSNKKAQTIMFALFYCKLNYELN